MSNKRDMEPSLDFYELRRRHEEFKNSQRQAKAQPKEAEPVEAEAVVDEAPVTEQAPSYADAPVEAAETAVDAEDTVPAPSADFVVEDTADAPEDGDYEDEDGGDADASDNPNPFDPFIHAFKGIRSRIGKRFGRGGEEEEEADEDEDEEYGDEDYEEEESGEAAAPVRPVTVAAKEDDAPAAEAFDLDAEGIDASRPAPQAISRPADEGDEAEADDFDGLETEEFITGHGQACAGCEEYRNDVAQCILSGIGKTMSYAGYFKQVAQAEHAHQCCYRREEQGYDDGYDDRECHLFEVGYRTEVGHPDLSLFFGGAEFHDRRLNQRNQGHVGVCCYCNGAQKMGSQFGSQINSGRAVSATDDADLGVGNQRTKVGHCTYAHENQRRENFILNTKTNGHHYAHIGFETGIREVSHNIAEGDRHQQKRFVLFCNSQIEEDKSYQNHDHIFPGQSGKAGVCPYRNKSSHKAIHVCIPPKWLSYFFKTELFLLAFGRIHYVDELNDESQENQYCEYPGKPGPRETYDLNFLTISFDFFQTGINQPGKNGQKIGMISTDAMKVMMQSGRPTLT